MSIDYNIDFQKTKSLYGPMSYESDFDFPTINDAKKSIKYKIDSTTCPSCGSKKINGSGFTYLVTKIRLHTSETKKTIFGTYKTIDKFWKVVYRVEQYPREKPAGFFSKGAYIKCKSCGHNFR